MILEYKGGLIVPKRERFDTLCIITNKAALLWKNARGIAPDDVADKMDIAMLNWQSSLTQALKIWIEKGLSMSTGELILARVNLGAVVESWLKFFYCVFYAEVQCLHVWSCIYGNTAFI